MPRLRPPLCLCLALVWSAASWGQSPPANSREIELKEIQVDGTRENADAQRVDPARSTTTVTGEELARKQPATIFEALRDVPGVSVQGGARPSGMRFNIRGYSDNEDLLIKLDGVGKRFEKYRFGGSFIEPELLKSIEVERAPALASGSGALGGTVSATTKDAADLLRPGQRYGARLKAGYGSNNDERLFSTSVYGRPHDQVDLLANLTRRFSNDITLPDGTPYANSKVDGTNALLKGTWFGETGWSLSGSAIRFDDSGLQPYDAAGGQPGFFGNVVRKVRDSTYATTLRYQPENSAWSGQLVYGGGTTRLNDQHLIGESNFANAVNGGLEDRIDYRNRSLDAWVQWRPNETWTWRAGIQHEDSDRDVSRFTVNAAAQAQYPGGFNPAQPPGGKRAIGAYLQSTLQLGPLALTPGVRWDRYEVDASGGTLDFLHAAGESPSIAFERTSPSFGAQLYLVPKRLSVFYNYIEAFRPPLIDEYFTQGEFSRCPANAPLESFLTAYRALQAIYATLPTFPPSIRTNFFNRILQPAFNSGVAAYNLAVANNPLGTLAPASGICGSLYKPEIANTQEVGVHLEMPLPWGKRQFLRAKLTYFEIRTGRLLESIRAADGAVDQPGWEHRHGIELEAMFDAEVVFARLAYARMRGTMNDFRSLRPIYDIPGNTISVTLGGRIGKRFEAGANYQQVDSRQVILSQSGPLTRPVYVIGTQGGHRVYGLFARYAPDDRLEVRLSVENLLNARYDLNDGFGGMIGPPAPGRNIRLSMAVAF